MPGPSPAASRLLLVRLGAIEIQPLVDPGAVPRAAPADEVVLVEPGPPPDQFARATAAIERSDCEWVVVSFGEMDFEPHHVAGLRACLARAGDAWGVLTCSARIPRVPTYVELCDSALAPPGERIVLRRERLASVGGLRARYGRLAPWAAFLDCAERGWVKVARQAEGFDAARLNPPDPGRSLEALRLQADRFGGWLTYGQQLHLLALAVGSSRDEQLASEFHTFLRTVIEQHPDILRPPALPRLACLVARPPSRETPLSRLAALARRIGTRMAR